jgi:hypothetical protein
VEAAKNEAILLSKQVETLVALRVKVKSLDSGKCLTLQNQLVR